MRHIYVKQPSMSFTLITIHSLNFNDWMLHFRCGIEDGKFNMYLCEKWWSKIKRLKSVVWMESWESRSFQATLQFQMTWVLLSSINITIWYIMHVTWSKAGVCLLFFFLLLCSSFRFQNEYNYSCKHELEFIHSHGCVCDLIHTYNRLAYLLIDQFFD